MKRELKIGNSQIITITDNGIVTVPYKVRMNISEIADLFGIFYQTVKRCVRDIEKSDIANGDYLMYSTVEGLKVCPDYYGLDMITAIAFRVQSAKTDILRKWVIHKTTKADLSGIILQSLQKTALN
jgi:hypothetical protein